ncbi:MAG: amino acid adenylation domain-containing protein [Clostridia bacterium]|nr:amino acid adenylation domain-containing protein [Clostridia bacterium]
MANARIKNVLYYLRNIVKTKPEKTAFSDGAVSYSFEQVYDKAGRIGSYLADNAIYKKPVVVFMRKSPDEVNAFFGVISGGCFYVPIDEEMPKDRIQLILNNVQSPLVICDEHTLSVAKGFDIPNGNIMLYGDIIKTETDTKALDEIYERSLDIDPIYIVFTSGSTGIPKGVAACHRSVIDYIEELSETLSFDENTVFGNQTPLYFDACLKELYPTLKFGATTYLIPKTLFSQPVALIEFLNKHKINTVCWVVSALTMISAFGTFEVLKPEYLHTIAFGSEVFPIKQFKIWKNALPHASFTNLYGPTEGTGMCCYYHVNRDFEDNEPIPIGRPFNNCEILLLTEDGKPAENGSEGEICIRGTAVTLGYYNDFDRTSKAFVQNPLNKAYPEIIYKTGDIGKLNSRGELIFVSRRDYQIKHMGHRIELGEIEVSANMTDAVKMAACIYDKTKGKIVLFYVGDCDEKSLTASLKERLPRYMIPNKILRLDKMPLTANGKLNRVKLAESYK